MPHAAGSEAQRERSAGTTDSASERPPRAGRWSLHSPVSEPRERSRAPKTPAASLRRARGSPFTDCVSAHGRGSLPGFGSRHARSPRRTRLRLSCTLKLGVSNPPYESKRLLTLCEQWASASGRDSAAAEVRRLRSAAQRRGVRLLDSSETDEIVRLYCDGATLLDIAHQFKVGTPRVKDVLVKANIKIRPKGTVVTPRSRAR